MIQISSTLTHNIQDSLLMSELKQARKLAQEMIDVESLIEEKESELKELKERLRMIKETDLPVLMESADLAEITLTDGRKIVIEVNYHSSITEENRAAAYRWLRETGRGGIIKRTVTMQFPKGKDENASKYAEWLRKKYPDYDITDAETIHSQTLKAFVREMMEEGEELPPSISVYRRTEAKIKAVKKKKA